jgi:zinc protease
VPAPGALHAPRALPGEIRRRRLDNGLEILVVRNAQAPIVTSALFYRVGTRDEAPGQGGIAHFLEHMMFKGSERYGPGEIDRRTQALGGTNNAFTSHDLTAYWFSFAADRWTEALTIEADRMRGLRLDPTEVDSERNVVLEEIAMYRDEPWDALELAVQEALYPGHPYGRPVLGTPEELRRIDSGTLAAFHARHYRPGNAILVLAGDVGPEAEERVEEAFGGLAGSAPRRAGIGAGTGPGGAIRIERRHGEVARWMLALPAPAPDTDEHAGLRLLATALTEGRSSRLHRILVDEEELCLSVSASLAETEASSHFAITAELVPGAEVAEVEERILSELARLREGPMGEGELVRAQRLFEAEWAYEIERIHEQAVVAGTALTLFDLGQPGRQLEAALAASALELERLARVHLDAAAGSVTGISLPVA